MKLGYFSPMPPAPTGVADYSAALLPYLEKLGSVAVNAPGDVNLYHIGNNHLHREIYERALHDPGVILLHDAVLHHFMLGTRDEAAYLDEFVFNYGDRQLAVDLWRERTRSGSDPRYFAHPMIRRIVERARAVIVHNPAAAAVVRAHGGEKIFEVPHLFRMPHLPAPAGVETLRRNLGAAPDTLLLGSFGHQRETKRLHSILRAFHKAAAPNVRLLVSGAFVSEPFERSVAPLLDHPRIVRTGYLPGNGFWWHAAAVDVCLNLRYPTAAETSGIAVSMMGIGKTVIFTAGEEISRFPEDACLRVEAGPGEETSLAEIIGWLAANHKVTREIGRRAAVYIAREHAPQKSAQLVRDAAFS